MTEKTGKREAKKTFFEVKAPMTAAKIMLYAGSAEELNGKVIILDLTRSLRGKNLEMRMRVVFDGTDLSAEPLSLALAGSYIRRMIRKGTDYVEDSFIAQCKDYRVAVKPFLITRNKVSRAIQNSLRTASHEFLTGYLTARTVKEMFSDITTNKVQKELSLKLKKIYPLALCEIRFFGIISEKKDVAEAKK